MAPRNQSIVTSIALHLDHRSWVFLVCVYALSKSNSFHKGHTLKTRSLSHAEGDYVKKLGK